MTTRTQTAVLGTAMGPELQCYYTNNKKDGYDTTYVESSLNVFFLFSQITWCGTLGV